MSSIGLKPTRKGTTHADDGQSWALALAFLALSVRTTPQLAALDTSEDELLKPAGDGDEIMGLVVNTEDRRSQGGSVTGTLFREGGFEVNIKANSGLARGDYVIAGGDNTVKPMPDNLVTIPRKWRCVSVIGSKAIIVAD